MSLEETPTIPASDFLEIIRGSSKIEGEITVGSTVAIILKGQTFIGKRTISIRTSFDLSYDRSVGIAHRCACLGGLMEWYVNNRNWKEGGYIVTHGNNSE